MVIDKLKHTVTAIILNDKNITEKTVILMFVIYKDLLKTEQNEKRTLDIK